MISFLIALIVLIAGYFIYGGFVEILGRLKKALPRKGEINLLDSESSPRMVKGRPIRILSTVSLLQ